MSLTDFLFQGSPPPQVTNYGSTTASLPPWFEAYQQALLGKSNVIAGEAFQPFTAPSSAAYDALKTARIAPFTDETQQGWQMGRDASTSYQPSLTAGINATAGALGQSAMGAAQPALDASMSAPTGLQTATPALNAGAASWPQIAAQYMNPFADQVTSRITDLSNRNLFENILPNINDNFVKSGQFGSSRQGDFTNRAVRDQQQTLSGTLADTLSGYYNQGAQQFGADASRQLQAGQIAGNLANTDITNLQNLGQIKGNLTNTDRTTTGVLGQDMGALGAKQQQLGITGAAVHEGIGQQQQGQQQQLLDTMYQNFLEQRNYPKDQASFMNNMIRGLQAPTSTTSAQTAPAQTYNAPPFAQLLGAGLGLSSLLGKARGGRVNFARGGRVVTRGGYLARARAA